MAKLMMVACKQLTFGKHVLLLLMFLRRPSHRTALGRFTGSWRDLHVWPRVGSPRQEDL